jgi:hypothetical protein
MPPDAGKTAIAQRIGLQRQLRIKQGARLFA